MRLAAHAPFQVRVGLSTFELHSGMLVLESTSPVLHAPETLASLATIADHIALVLQDRSVRAQIQELSERNRERAETLDQILEISNDLKRNRTLDDLFQSIATAVARSLGFQRVVLSTYDRERNAFTAAPTSASTRRWPGLQGGIVPAEEITKHWNDRNRVSKSYHVRERAREAGERAISGVAPRPRRPATTRGGRTSCSGFPCTRRTACSAASRSTSRATGGPPGSRRSARSRSSPTRRSPRSRAPAPTTRRASSRSATRLTGAYNHRHFQEVLQREIGRAERQGRPLTVLMLDIDDFKSINDRFGHPVGDAILQGIVAEIRNEVRNDMDLLARYGGDEFALVLPETPLAEAIIVAERVRRRVDERLFRMPDSHQVLRATVSIGLATYPGRLRRQEGPGREGGRRALPGQARRKERRGDDVGGGAGAAALLPH